MSSVKMDDSCEKEAMDHLYPHVFLPIRLPEQNFVECQGRSVDAELLTLMTNVILNFPDSESLLPKTRKTFLTWNRLQGHEQAGGQMDPNIIREGIHQLTAGDTFALYVRSQNAGFMVTEVTGDEDGKVVIASAWVASQRSEVVTSSESVSLAGVFPSISVCVPNSSFLKSTSFSRQLSDLDIFKLSESIATIRKKGHEVNDSREVTDPLYICQWVIGILSDEHSCNATEEQLPRIVKKIRDRVVFTDKYGVFQRSGMWLCAKVVAQVSLIRELGRNLGTFVYKMIMLRVHLSFLHTVPDDLPSKAALLAEFMAKTARRYYKLDNLYNQYQLNTDLNKTDTRMFNQVSVDAVTCMKNMHKQLMDFWKERVEEHQRKSHLPPLRLQGPDFRVNYFPSRNGLQEYLDRKESTFAPRPVPIPRKPPRHRDKSRPFPETHMESPLVSSQNDLVVALWDFEENVIMWPNFLTINHFLYVSNSFRKYVVQGKAVYSSDPVGYSRFILTCLKMLAIMDDLCVKEFPLLREHRPGIDLGIIAADLLLPRDQDMQTLSSLEDYFRSRTTKALYPSMIEEDRITRHSFTARYAGANHAMSSTKYEILEISERQRQEKVREVREKREECENLRARIRRKKCKYYYDYEYRRRHSGTCKRCELEEQEKSMRVLIHEEPLPDEDHEQNAVVFELMIPKELGVLRDLLVLFWSQVIGASDLTSSGQNFVYEWTEYPALIEHLRRPYLPDVRLKSTTKPFIFTHFKSLHPSEPDSKFLRRNGMNIWFSGCQICTYLPDMRTARCKMLCSLKVESGSPYAGLQWAMEAGSFSPNQALARQYECHRDLGLTEFQEFVGLRTSWRLQLRNIFRALTQMTLSLKAESVVHLLCQSFWQAGEPADGIYREAFEDFRNQDFVTEFLKLLRNLLEKHAGNWEDHSVLLIIVTFGTRVTRLSQDSSNLQQAMELLSRCREVAKDWSERVEKILEQLTVNAPISETNSLRIKVVEINVCAALTFAVHEGRIRDLVITPVSNLTDWFQAITNIYDNQPRSGSSPTLLFWLRRVLETAIVLEPHIAAVLSSSCSCLNEFVTNHYRSALSLTNFHLEVQWKPYGEAPQVYFVTLKTPDGHDTVLQMDIRAGVFLVDGAPVTRLSEQIERHAEYQRVFPTKSFEVQPCPGQPGRMVTKNEFQGSTYTFYMDGGNELVVQEHRNNKETWQLIPHHYMKRNVAHLVVEDYSHWFCTEKKIIEFFWRDKNNPVKLTCNNEPNYRWDLRTGTLTELASKHLLIDVNCPAYLQITHVLQRLEHPKYMMMFSSPKQYFINAPRIGLTFFVSNVEMEPKRDGIYKIRKDGMDQKESPGIVLLSNEYHGMKVAGSQNLNTLIGLTHGLLLEDADVNCSAKKNNVLLMPHGFVKRSSNQTSVELVHSEWKDPSFFIYEVDPLLRQIKAGESYAGWLYLALLHAMTSSPFPDPFTLVTGTERAFQILQSGHCWNGRPLEYGQDWAALVTLQDIAKLSPQRRFYPEKLQVMEWVEWPQFLDPQASHDGFCLITRKLLTDSRRLDFIHSPGTSKSRNSEETNVQLTTKAYWSRYPHTTELGRINALFHPEFKKGPSPESNNCYRTGFSDNVSQCVLEVAQLVRRWEFKVPGNKLRQNMLVSFLFHGDMKGVSKQGFEFQEGLAKWSNQTFRDSWLDLYNLARVVTRRNIREEWLFILGFFTFHTQTKNPASLQDIHVFQTVAANVQVFEHIDPPDYSQYYNLEERSLDLHVVRAIIDTNNAKSLESFLEKNISEKWCTEDMDDYVRRMTSVRDYAIEEQASRIFKKLQMAWPLENATHLFPDGRQFPELNLTAILHELNKKLKDWYRNFRLHEFVTKVEQGVLTLEGCQSQVYKNTSADLQKERQSGPLMELCRKEPTGIDFVNIIDKRANFSIPNEFEMRSIKIFCFGRESLVTKVKGDKDIPAGQKLRMDESLVTGSVTTSLKSGIKTDFPLQTQTNCPILQEFMSGLEQSWVCMTQQPNLTTEKFDSDAFVSEVEENLQKRRASRLELWETIVETIRPTTGDVITEILDFGFIFPRICPLSLLPRICQPEGPESLNLGYLRVLLGAFGVLLTEEQRATRICKLSQACKSSVMVELQREVDNPGHVNWIPKNKPEWLLFEIEMDLMVRPVQAQVAERMEHPGNSEKEDGMNALMQLNMGEGKTAVIVPLLVLSLANGKQLCRVTVLKSLLDVNRRALIHRIGGLMLNRRVYSFPCRRDYSLDAASCSRIQSVYEECLQRRGCVLTLPEYRLSFELKAYEFCRARRFSDGRALFGIQNWLAGHARDVLDESDEILQVKYQLIYTLGQQCPVGGGSLRWIVLQKLLALVGANIDRFEAALGPDQVEYKKRKKTQKFSYFRILDPTVFSKFTKLVADEILSGRSSSTLQLAEAPPDVIPSVQRFLTDEHIPKPVFDKVFACYKETSQRDRLLILRGFLACGVLTSCLNKRWRVNFGVNPKGHRRIAVPFRAKDVASERTEFGHPDVAILLTQLSYYYSGLSDAQLMDCFARILRQPNPTMEYARWIALVPTNSPGYATIESLTGVNLKDYDQRTKVLFPALRKNMAVVDFWLSHAVFPMESKQFSWKIGCSPWDLCGTGSLLTTGFSGTNDTTILLPTTIQQRDLPELQGTNGLVLRNLLLPENNIYRHLPCLCTGKQLLESLCQDGICVLLDVGALMTELTNQQVAQTWLSLYDDYGENKLAAVYFDDNNRLVVYDKALKQSLPLEVSTYRTRLDNCLIYLDDAHTRGTDLKIPYGTLACVTLGKGVTKDKLVQGCMRMRKLGQGHRVCFWATQEVHSAIVAITGNKFPETRDVLNWSIQNTLKAITDGFIHWITSGVYQAQKQSARHIFEESDHTDEDLELLSNSCVQKDQVDLMIMYGEPKSLMKYPVIVEHLLRRVQREMESLLKSSKAGQTAEDNVWRIVTRFGESVQEHTNKYVADMERTLQILDEEQERELEHELEAEYEKEVPPKVPPAGHKLSADVQNFIVTGNSVRMDRWAFKLPLSLKESALWKFLSENDCDTWARNVYASHDFSRVILHDGPSDDFLRPPQWVACLQKKDPTCGTINTIVLLLSPFEVDAYLPWFRSGVTPCRLLMMTARLSPNQDILLRNPRLALPRFPPSTTEVTLPRHVISTLLLYSGSSYFGSQDEETSWCENTGFCPGPRTDKQLRVYDAKGIVNGFVLPEFRSQIGYDSTTFQTNPELFIRALIEARFKGFSDDSHVGRIMLARMHNKYTS